MPTVAFVSNGLTISWHTAGPVAQVLAYTVSVMGGLVSMMIGHNDGLVKRLSHY